MENLYFSSTNRSTAELLQPLYVRTRHRYRGPRESMKFALSSQSMYADLYRLYDQANATEGTFDSLFDLLNGIDSVAAGSSLTYFDSITVHRYSNAATPPSDISLAESLPTIQELRDTIVSLESKLDSLENS